METWLPIPGWETLYQASSLGRVRRIPSTRIRKVHPDRTGYLAIVLHNHGQRRTCKVHRLIAKTFLPNPDNLPQVHHKNGDKTDNRTVNLEWVTRIENVRHYYKTEYKGQRKEQDCRVKLNRTQVVWLLRLSKSGYSSYNLAEIFNISRLQVSNIVSGKSWANVPRPV